MSRQPRFDATGIVCHVLNRSAKRQPLFLDDTAYRQFHDVLEEALARHPVRLLGYCTMPNHWHLVLWPQRRDDLRRFAHWMTLTHAHRWHRLHASEGTGAVYQGRYRAIPVQTDRHFYTLMRYVERNPVRAGLVTRAEDWMWSSASTAGGRPLPPLEAWPVPRPADWLSMLNDCEPAADLRRLRDQIRQSLPVGDAMWTRRFLAMGNGEESPGDLDPEHSATAVVIPPLRSLPSSAGVPDLDRV